MSIPCGSRRRNRRAAALYFGCLTWSSSFASWRAADGIASRKGAAGRAHQSRLALSTFLWAQPIDEAAQKRFRETPAIEPPDPVLRGHPGQFDTEAITNLARGLHAVEPFLLSRGRHFLPSSCRSRYVTDISRSDRVARGAVLCPHSGHELRSLRTDQCWEPLLPLHAGILHFRVGLEGDAHVPSVRCLGNHSRRMARRS